MEKYCAFVVQYRTSGKNHSLCGTFQVNSQNIPWKRHRCTLCHMYT